MEKLTSLLGQFKANWTRFVVIGLAGALFVAGPLSIKFGWPWWLTIIVAFASGVIIEKIMQAIIIRWPQVKNYI